MNIHQDNHFLNRLNQLRFEKNNYQNSPKPENLEQFSQAIISFYEYITHHQPSGGDLPKIHKMQSDFVLMACLEDETNNINGLHIEGVNLLLSQISFFNFLYSTIANNLILDLTASAPHQIKIVFNTVIDVIKDLKNEYLHTLASLEALKMLNLESASDLQDFREKIADLSSKNLETLFDTGKVILPLGWSLPKPFSGHHFYGLLTLSNETDDLNAFNLRIDLINSKIDSKDQDSKQNISMAFDNLSIEKIKSHIQVFLTMHLPKITVKKACSAYKTTPEKLTEINLEQELTKYIYSAINDIGTKLDEPTNRYRKLHMVPSKACTSTTLLPLLLVISNSVIKTNNINLSNGEKKYLKFCFEHLLYAFKRYLLSNIDIKKSLKLQKISPQIVLKVNTVLSMTFFNKTVKLQNKYQLLQQKFSQEGTLTHKSHLV